MKKIKVLAVVVLLVLGCFNLSYAAGLGPMRPLGNMKVCAALDSDYIFNRTTKAKVDIETTKVRESNRIFALLGVGLSDYCNLYARVGAGNHSDRSRREISTFAARCAGRTHARTEVPSRMPPTAANTHGSCAEVSKSRLCR